MTLDPTAAFHRLVDALNRPRDPALLRAAVTDEIRIDRYVPGARATALLAETFAGFAAVERWFARMPDGVRFSLAGAVWTESRAAADAASGAGWGVEYAYDAHQFHHGGIWISWLADDGRVAVLSHHPFALRDAPGPPQSPHAHGGSGHTHGG